MTNHVVSLHAAKIIRNFLSACECAPDEETPQQPADKLEDPAEISTAWVDVSLVQRLTIGDGFNYPKRSAATVHNLVDEWGSPLQHVAGTQFQIQPSMADPDGQPIPEKSDPPAMPAETKAVEPKAAPLASEKTIFFS